jgi:squalene-hopene/tetraprenyl-beta-curcumene cyclase
MLDSETVQSSTAYDLGAPAVEISTRRENDADGLHTLRAAIAAARQALLARQHAEGYWCFELEADCTIPAQYILMMHFMDEIDTALERKIAAYLRARRGTDGGWSLYPGSEIDISGTVLSYYALKLTGDPVNAPHMKRAREAILARGGAARSNVFTRITLAMFEQLPWRGVPLIPVELMLLPRWFPFHLSKVSYWTRTVVVPLSVLCSLKARARNPRGVGIRELFTVPPEEETNYFPVRSWLNHLFLFLQKPARRLEPVIAKVLRKRALRSAETWIIERLNGEDGLGAIFPAMVNAHEALALLGYPPHHAYRRTAKRALENLLVIEDDTAHCQPCVSPVWDTVLAVAALHESDDGTTTPQTQRALDWMSACQILDGPADWRDKRPALAPGGWPFQFGNSHYPDLDDTAVVAAVMQSVDPQRYRVAIERAVEWIAGMQSRNGGFAAFDVDNTHYYLNEIPFADHGALLDPPTSDVTARCVQMFSRVDPKRYQTAIARGMAYLMREQEPDGSWFGRWGTNYLYGTWSVLAALETAASPRDHAAARAAVGWLKRKQRADGGWGESNDSYHDATKAAQADNSSAFQTAWAILGLLAAGETHSSAVQRGVEYLLCTQRSDGEWSDPVFTAPGFPRVFYLKYHGYDKYFPLWALARYANLVSKAKT